ncbi:MAG: alpha/beta hydrolase [Erysipelotrichaceae bacterium]|nr:alpha/beta hydrolase [Erysipelotrichaceae bacterium]
MEIREYGKENSEVIMLLHGGGLSWWNFRSEAELLQDRYHVILPVLDGHSDTNEPFTTIEDNAQRLIEFIDERFNGQLLLIGGLSLGGQVLTEMFAQRHDICEYAVIESASVIQSGLTEKLIGPSVSSSYGLISKEWFSRMQFRYLGIRKDLFEDYYRDTVKITKDNMISFLKASSAYQLKEDLRQCNAKVRVVVGSRELKNMIGSARMLNETLPQSTLEIKEGLIHGQYSLNQPEEYVKDVLRMLEQAEGKD